MRSRYHDASSFICSAAIAIDYDKFMKRSCEKLQETGVGSKLWRISRKLMDSKTVIANVAALGSSGKCRRVKSSPRPAGRNTHEVSGDAGQRTALDGLERVPCATVETCEKHK